MHAPKIISERDQLAISDLIENFMPDDEKSLDASEIIKHLGDKLSDDAGENQLIEHLSKNSEKNFTRDELKVLAGQFGVEQYKANFEAATPEDPSNNEDGEEYAGGLYGADPDAVDRFMNGPSGSPRKLTAKERIDALSQENSIIFRNLKAEWLAKNSDKFKDMDEAEIDRLADELIIDALQKSIEMNAKQSQEPSAHFAPQPMMSQGEVMGQSAHPMAVEGNALLGIARQAFSFAAEATSTLVGGALGALSGVKKGFANSDEISGLTVAPEEYSESVESVEATFADRVAESTRLNMESSVAALNEKVDEIKSLRESGDWTDKSFGKDKREKLKSLDSNISEVDDLRKSLSADLKRSGVDESTSLDGIKALDEAKKSIKNAGENLGNSQSEKEIKEKTNKIMKAIESVIKAIKKLFSKEKTDDEPENKNDEGNTLSM